MSRVSVVAKSLLHEISRRRGVLLLVVLLPLAFYLVRRDHTGQSIRFLAFGVAWAVATLALFAGHGWRSLDARLRVSGYSTTSLLLGRLLAVWAVGMLLAAGFYLLVALDKTVPHQSAVGLLLVTSVLISAPLGALIADLVPGDLEGALLLLVVVAVQWLADPEGSAAKLLPWWSTRELATYAVDDPGTDYLTRGVIHATATTAILLILLASVGHYRRRLHHPAELANTH